MDLGTGSILMLPAIKIYNMKKYSLIILLFFYNYFAYSQNIYSALRLNQDRDYKTEKPKKIIETNTFYNSFGKTVEKSNKIYNASGMLLIEERFDETGKLNARLSYENDTINKLKLSRTFERWNQLGYSKEIAVYSYDKNNILIRTIDKDAKGNILYISNLVNNEQGDPVELFLFDGRGNSYGKETAKYYYDRNEVETSVVSNDGKILSSDTMKIRYKAPEPLQKDTVFNNENGDNIRWTSTNLNGTETIYEAEYLYDSHRNCTVEKIFIVTEKKGGKKKKKIARIFKKEYTY